MSDENSQGPDPMDLDALWCPLGIVDTVTVTSVIRAGTRPPKDKFIQVMPFVIHANPSECTNCRPVRMVEVTVDGDLSPTTYYVLPNSDAFQALLPTDKLLPALLVLAIIYRTNEVFVWELKLPRGNVNSDKWANSRLELVRLATTKWLKPRSNLAAGGYNYDVPIAEYDPPDWSKVDFANAIKVACKDRIITDRNHEALRDILGL